MLLEKPGLGRVVQAADESQAMQKRTMKTTIGVTAGRFQMTHADAETLDSKKMTREEYFVRKVIY